MTTIYKIFRAEEWREAEQAGVFTGSVHDKRDGFIHFSTAEQARETAAKHFAGPDGAGEHGLVLAEIDAAQLGDALKWEPSRGGALFPHLYAALPLSAVTRTWPLPIENGVHQFPKDLTHG